MRATAEYAKETSETELLRQEVAELNGMVRELIGGVEQHEQSYSEKDSEGESDRPLEEAQQTQYACNQPLYYDDNEAPCEKSQSEPNLSESVSAVKTTNYPSVSKHYFPIASIPILSIPQHFSGVGFWILRKWGTKIPLA